MNIQDADITSTISLNGKYGRVFDGKSFHDVNRPLRRSNIIPPQNLADDAQSKSSIFVSIPQFRDGKRCARTLHRLFSLAAHPDRIYVGLIEQTNVESKEDDPTCLLEYCALLGYKMKVHEAGIAHKSERQADYDDVMENCPRAMNQIRSVRFHSLGAKGPVYARSFIRKLLGNEQFCMQIDAATDFAQGWDKLAVEQWIKTGNEYAVLSNVPQSEKEKNKNLSNMEVPRQCSIKIGSEGVPLFDAADGKAIGLKQPLLATSYSPSFALAKCHYETNVPHDPFAVQLLETEKFPRFARLWTRGYDVYTPSLNIVYKDTSVLHPLHHTAGHGEAGEKKWPKNDSERKQAHIRMKVLLDIHHGITSAEASMLGGSGGNSIGGKISTARANLGIYGLGKRRTLSQLLEFTGIALPSSDFTGQHGNGGNGCSNPEWVPYDASISPRANLYDGTGKADDLDLDPEFPLRTLPDATGGQYDHPFAMGNAAWEEMTIAQKAHVDGSSHDASSDVPYSFVLLLWMIGLCTWYGMYVGGGSSASKTKKGVGKQQTRSLAKKARPLAERTMLKNV